MLLAGIAHCGLTNKVRNIRSPQAKAKGERILFDLAKFTGMYRIVLYGNNLKKVINIHTKTYVPQCKLVFLL